MAVAALVLVLVACGGGQPRPRISEQTINRVLASAPGAAQPSNVVATDLAFARAAREQGQWTAFRAFAAPGAVIHGRNGPVEAASWLAGRNDPDVPVQWAPRSIWMSCSGRLAVSQGRFRDAKGLVGNYVTVWEQQPDRSYKWVYDVAAPDDPQPPPPEPDEPLGPFDIVVTSIDAVSGLVADCPRRGGEVPTAPAVAITDDASQGGRMSHDGTLRWRWEHGGEAQRRIVVDWLTSGKWEVGLDQTLPAPQE